MTNLHRDFSMEEITQINSLICQSVALSDLNFELPMDNNLDHTIRPSCEIILFLIGEMQRYEAQAKRSQESLDECQLLPKGIVKDNH